MRDPDLVLRAQRAAAALERAWYRWRLTHGLGADPLPPVSSYVGYSLEEPWGQPRVVFGVDAEEAEQLAALLDRNDFGRPAHIAAAVPPNGRQPAGPPNGREPAGPPNGRQPAAPPPNGREPAALPPNGRQSAGLPNGRQSEGLPNGRQSEGLPNGRQSAGLPNGRQSEGLPNGRQSEGLPNGRQLAGPLNGRQPAASAGLAEQPPGGGHGRVHVWAQGPASAGQGQLPDEHRSQVRPSTPDASVRREVQPVPEAALTRQAVDQDAAAASEAEATGAQLAQAAAAPVPEAPSPGLAPNSGSAPAREAPAQAAQVQAAAVQADPAQAAAAQAAQVQAAAAQAAQVQAAAAQADSLQVAAAQVAPAASLTPLAPVAPEASPGPSEPGEPEVVAFRPGPELASYPDEGPEPELFMDAADDLAEDQHSFAKHARANRISRGHSMPRLTRPKRPGAGPERDLAVSTAAMLPQVPGRKPEGNDRRGLAAMAADAIGWASGELPGQAAATDTAV